MLTNPGKWIVEKTKYIVIGGFVVCLVIYWAFGCALGSGQCNNETRNPPVIEKVLPHG